MNAPELDLARDQPPAPRSGPGAGGSAGGGPVGLVQLLLGWVNAAAAVASAIAIGIAGCVLTWAATARYIFHMASDWQDELSIFLLVGATFMAAAWVQARRGHVGIQALSAVLPAKVDRWRRYVSDIITFVFCAFYSWKSWTLLIDAVRDGQISNSAWGAPLWIPYGCMAAGMSLLTLQLLLQAITLEAFKSTETSAH
ncbi:MAG: transporter permease DctQ [Betaproteobacteria bacterium]|nr:transporter permease DctQ [Betaproteobacteria bacterium]